MSVFHVVEPKLLRVAKVLKDLSIFVGDRNSHDGFSFRFCVLLRDFLLVAATAARISSAAQRHVAALDPQGQAVHQHIRQLFARAGVDMLYRGAGHLHLLAALLLRKPFFVDEADRLVFIHRQDDGRLTRAAFLRRKGQRPGIVAHPAAFSRSCQMAQLLPS